MKGTTALMRSVLNFAVLAALCLFLPYRALAQFDTATVLGTVRDAAWSSH